jgi:hypothetical protein
MRSANCFRNVDIGALMRSQSACSQPILLTARLTPVRSPPLFATPFITASTGQNNGQPFPYTFAPLNSSRSNPDPNIDWSTYEPIEGIPGYDIHNRTPYTEEWMLSIERQAGPNTVLGATYIGTSTHRQRVLIEPNPGNPALCLSLPGCSPGGENGVYVTAEGVVVNGTRGPLGSNFGSNALQSNIGSANYNALELSARHTSGRLAISAAYTTASRWTSRQILAKRSLPSTLLSVMRSRRSR